MLPKILILLLALTLTLTPTGCKRAPVAQEPYPQDEFISRESNIGEDRFRYRVYVPLERKGDDPLPVMLYLHGAGNRGKDNETQLNGLAEVIRSNRESFSFIVVIPQCLDGRFWDAGMIARANQALNEVIVEFSGDPKRLYLAGFSLGGYGVWSMAATYPEKFAALVPMAGRVVPRPVEEKSVSPKVAELAKSSDVYRAFAEAIGKTPVWIFHGSEDRIVPVDSSRRMSRSLMDAGNLHIKYSEVAGAGHEPLAFRTTEFFSWLGEQKIQ
jgi:predicted peptidase